MPRRGAAHTLGFRLSRQLCAYNACARRGQLPLAWRAFYFFAPAEPAARPAPPQETLKRPPRRWQVQSARLFGAEQSLGFRLSRGADAGCRGWPGWAGRWGLGGAAAGCGMQDSPGRAECSRSLPDNPDIRNPMRDTGNTAIHCQDLSGCRAERGRNAAPRRPRSYLPGSSNSILEQQPLHTMALRQ